MIKISEIKMPVGYTEEMVTASILKKLHLKNDTALTWNYFKKSIDARKKQQIQYQISVLVSHPNEQKLLQQASARKEKNITSYQPYVYPVPSISKKPENPLTFLTLLYIVYLLSFDGKSGVGTDAGGFRRGEVIL